MELIFGDKYYDNTDNYEETSFALELKSELLKWDVDVKVIEGDIGHGADWPVVLAEIFNSVDWTTILKTTSIPAVFFLGKKINENLEAWLSIGKKLKQVIIKLKPVRIDEQAALLIVLEDLLTSKNNINKLEIILKIHSYDIDVSLSSSLLKRPDSLYIFNIETEDNFFVYGIKSDSHISFKHEYGKNWYDFLED